MPTFVRIAMFLYNPTKMVGRMLVYPMYQIEPNLSCPQGLLVRHRRRNIPSLYTLVTD